MKTDDEFDHSFSSELAEDAQWKKIQQVSVNRYFIIMALIINFIIM